MSPTPLLAAGLLALGTLSATAQTDAPPPEHSDEDSTTESHTIDCRLGREIRLAQNPTRETVAVRGLVSDVQAAYLTDVSGRSVVELGESGRSAEWRLPAFGLDPGLYYLTLYSAGEWHALAVELE